jgi:hypothetical protein
MVAGAGSAPAPQAYEARDLSKFILPASLLLFWNLFSELSTNY